MLVKLFEEVAFIWPKLGYPHLVTPFSKYVKNVALLNVMQLIKGKERYSMIDNNTWDMILGKAGKLPGKLAPEIIEIAKAQGKEFYKGVPQDAYPNELDKYKEEMKQNNWDLGKDNEELFELAMHPREYRDYKSGIAKKRFEDELLKVKSAKISVLKAEVKEAAKSEDKPKQTQKYIDPDWKEIKSPYKGKGYFLGFEEDTLKIGDHVKKGTTLCYVESMLVYYEIKSEYNGRIADICFKSGKVVNKNDVLIRIEV